MAVGTAAGDGLDAPGAVGGAAAPGSGAVVNPRSAPETARHPLRSLPRSAASQPWAIVAGYGGNQAVWSRRAGKAVLAVGIPSLASRAKDAGVEGGGFLSGRRAATEPAHPPPARRFPWRHRP